MGLGQIGPWEALPLNRQTSFLLAAFLASGMLATPASSDTTTNADRKLIIDTFRAEALTGDSSAMLQLGRAYQSGRDVGRDVIESWVWLNIAALRHTDAARERDQLELDMSLDDILKAEVECLRILSLLNTHRRSTRIDPEIPVIRSK